MSGDLEKQDENKKPERDSKGRLLPGYSGNPNGRPKGETLKEFAREWYMKKTPEEKIAYIESVEEKKPGFAWQMAEGMPSTKTEIKADVQVSSLSDLTDEELDAILTTGSDGGEGETGEGES